MNMLPPSVTIGFLLLTALILGYLVGHKKGLQEGIQLAKELGVGLQPKEPQPLPPPEPDEDPSESLILDNYKVYRNGVIVRGGLEVALVDDESPFHFEKLHGVDELKADDEHCRKLSRLWFEEFGLDAGKAIKEKDYFVSKSGLFWRKDLAFGRMNGKFDGFESFGVSNEYFAKPTPEDLQHCNNLVERWKKEFG
jgi:hypothetical protein